MPPPIVSTLPPAPLVTDSRSTFNDKSFVFVGSLSQFVTEVNAVASWIDTHGADARQNNLTATTDPTASDDSADGYEPLSQWLNTTTGEVFICVSASVGAAIWQKGTLTVDELGNLALINASAVGVNFAQLPNPGAVTFVRVNADNTVSLLSPSDFRTAIGAGTGGGSVTSVSLSAPTGLQVSGSPVTTSGTLAISFASGYSIPTTTKQGEWDSAYSDRLKWDGGSTGLNASTARTSLGATTVGSSFITTANPSAISYPRVNANNSITYVSASTLAGELGVNAKLDSSAVGVTVASLVAGVVPSSQLPSYVDDVLEFANLAAFPATGESGKIYIALDTNRSYRWSGSTYVQIVASPGTTDNVTEGSTNLYFTQARVRTTPLTGFAAGVGLSAVLATDTVLQAFQKIQGWLNGLGNAATATVVSSATDTTAGRLANVGWMGLGAGVVSVADMTSAEVNVNRIFRMNAAATGGNGLNMGMISMALDGTPITGYFGMALDGTPYVARKAGASATPVYRQLLDSTSPINASNISSGTLNASRLPFTYTNQGTGDTVVQRSSTGTIIASGVGGFASESSAANTRNPIWRFASNTNQGISYFTGSSGYGGSDSIGIHFTSATGTASQFIFTSSGDLRISGQYTGDGGGITSLNASNLSAGTVPAARLTAGTTTVAGIVQLSDSIASTSTTLAATANSVKTAYDLANGKAKKTALVTVSTSTHNIDATNESGYHRFTFSGAKSATVRPNSTHVLPTDGSWVLRNSNTGNLTIIAGSGVTINVPYAGSLVLEPGMAATLQKVGTDVYDLIGQTVTS